MDNESFFAEIQRIDRELDSLISAAEDSDESLSPGANYYLLEAQRMVGEAWAAAEKEVLG